MPRLTAASRFPGSATYGYPVPAGLNYLWNFGVYSTFCLLVQLTTGLAVTMYYLPSSDSAFSSIDHLMRDVNLGWLFRYAHANAASVFFFSVYLHLFRGLYYGSYSHPRRAVWHAGVVALALMVVSAFLGYSLPWGQMSFWAATVITNLFSAIPVFGSSLVSWVWGGFSLGTPTLGRFLSFHIAAGFSILGVVACHFYLLHVHGSSSPLGVELYSDSRPMYPYFLLKDFLGLVAIFGLLAGLVFFFPNFLGHPDNYVPANPMVTPAHIVPEWYFLPFYAVLRSVPDKFLGTVAFAMSIGVLALVPYLDLSPVRSGLFRPSTRVFVYGFCCFFGLLGWVGGQPVEFPLSEAGRLLCCMYFFSILGLLPVLGLLDRLVWLGYTPSQLNFPSFPSGLFLSECQLPGGLMLSPDPSLENYVPGGFFNSVGSFKLRNPDLASERGAYVRYRLGRRENHSRGILLSEIKRVPAPQANW